MSTNVAGVGSEPLLVRARALVERFVPSRGAALLCFVLALGVYGIESIAWPLSGGRDGATYLMYYVDMWHAHPAYPELMLFRMPLAPLFDGSLLQLGGPILLEVAMAVLYACSVLAFAMAALVFSRWAAVATALLLLLYPGYGAMFHEVSSDPIFAFVYAIWTLATIRALRAPQTWKFAVLGVVFMALVLVRPVAQVMILFALAPLLIGAAWRRKLAWAGTFVGVSAALLAVWAGYNDLRYGEFVVARAGWASVPFLRVFEMDKFVSSTNGPASRELADAVKRRLLPYPPYPQLGITTPDQFFGIASDHMWGDVVVISDREWGWGSNYAILRRVSSEAIRRHFKLYVRDVATAVWFELRHPYQPVAPLVSSPATAVGSSSSGDSVIADPGGRFWWLASTPDGKPPVRARVDRLARELQRLPALPDRSGSQEAARALNAVSRAYPWMGIWLVIALVALVVRRPLGSIAVLVSLALALLVILVTEMGQPPGLEYGLPFLPVFLLCGIAALLGKGRGWRFPRAELAMRRAWNRLPSSKPIA